MQTFLSHYCALDIARSLDDKRLNKQILECDQLLDLILGIKDNQWKNHPACRMWIDYPDVLLFYRNTMRDEWRYRGKNDSRGYRHDISVDIDNITYPPFMQDPRIILSHRSNLMKKYPQFYSKYGWMDFGLEGYYWPVPLKTKKVQVISDKWTELVDQLSKYINVNQLCE